MIWIGEMSLAEMPSTDPPKPVQDIFDIVKKAKGLDHIKLHYILNETAMSHARGCLVSIGRIGWAEDGTAYVIECDSIDDTIGLVLHELRHFYDGPHPWPEEKERCLAER